MGVLLRPTCNHFQVDQGFTSGRYFRRFGSEAALPWLYLKGISTGEMGSALKVLLGPEATGFRSRPASSRRLCTKPVVCRNGSPNRTLIVRQAGVAASLNLA